METLLPSGSGWKAATECRMVLRHWSGRQGDAAQGEAGGSDAAAAAAISAEEEDARLRGLASWLAQVAPPTLYPLNGRVLGLGFWVSCLHPKLYFLKLYPLNHPKLYPSAILSSIPQALSPPS